MLEHRRTSATGRHLAAVVLLSLTLSCLAQFPFDVSQTFQVPVQPGSTPAIYGRPAATWNGSEYLLAWRDGRRGNGRMTLFATALAGGSLAASVPGGNEVPQSVGVSAGELQLVATKTFSMLVAPLVSPDGGVRLHGWKTGVGTWDGGWEPRFDIAGTNIDGPAAAGANDRDALVVWATPTAIRGAIYPSGMPISINGLDAGVQSLSAGGIDGGFVVSWVETGGKAQAVRVLSTMEPIEPVASSGVVFAQALTNRSAELVVTQSSTLNLHGYNGSWSSSSIGTPVGIALATSSASVIFTAVPTGFSWTASANWATTFAAAPSTPLGALSAVLTLAGRDDSSRALMVFRIGSRDLQVRELSAGAAGQPFTMTPVVLGLAVQPLVAPASQRSPSVVWFDPKARFLLAWEEDTADGGSAVRMSLLNPGQAADPSQVLALPSPIGAAKPELLRAPGGVVHAVAVSRNSSRIVYPLDEIAGELVIGAALTSPRALPNAVLGDRIAMQWGSQGGLTAIANTETMARIVSAELAPRCVAVTRDKLWFVTNGSNGVYSVDDQNAVVGAQSTLLSWIGPPIVTPCAQATSTTPPIIYLAGTDGGLVQVRSFSPVVAAPFPVARLGNFGAIADELSAEPVIATVDAGALVTWASARNGMQVGWATSSGVLQGPALGGDDVTAVSIASNPAGQTVIAWETFDVKLGMRRVQFRALLPPGIDAGVIDSGVIDSGAIDSGVVPFIDAGAIDASVLDPDSGVTVSDSGVVDQDAGVIDQDSGVIDRDAGVVDQDSGITIRDAGIVPGDSGVDADGGVEVVFVPVCGCSESGSGVLPFFLLAAVMLVWRRRTHV